MKNSIRLSVALVVVLVSTSFLSSCSEGEPPVSYTPGYVLSVEQLNDYWINDLNGKTFKYVSVVNSQKKNILIDNIISFTKTNYITKSSSNIVLDDIPYVLKVDGLAAQTNTFTIKTATRTLSNITVYYDYTNNSAGTKMLRYTSTVGSEPVTCVMASID